MQLIILILLLIETAQYFHHKSRVPRPIDVSCLAFSQNTLPTLANTFKQEQSNHSLMKLVETSCLLHSMKKCSRCVKLENGMRQRQMYFHT